MKTLKALKITSILQIIFCLFCIASTICFALNHYYDIYLFFGIGMLLMYGWMINPIGIVSFIICLVSFLAEHKQAEFKQMIGKKWIWIFVWPVITTALWIIAGGLFVTFTGGV